MRGQNAAPQHDALRSIHTHTDGTARSLTAAETRPALLSLHVYRFRLRTEEPVEFPTFPGPALRGALGDDRAAYAAFFSPPAAALRRRVLWRGIGAGVGGEAGNILVFDQTSH